MPSFYPYGGLYDRIGYARRNEPVAIPECNPLPENKLSSDTGNAGADGYTVLSRASRYSGERPFVEGEPVYEGPQMSED